MTELSDRVRHLISQSKTRLDFAVAIQESRDLVDEIYRDGTLLEMQKRNAVAAVNAAIEVLQNRYDSPSQLGEALESVSDVADVLEEPSAGLLAQWFFHIAYSGQEVAATVIETARRIISKRQSNEKENERELSLALDRYEWLASFGVRPELSRNNAQGVIVATAVRPLSSAAAATLASRASTTIRIADERSGKPAADLVREAIVTCRKLIADARRTNTVNPASFMAQTPSYCVRVTLSSAEDLLRTDAALAELRDELSEEIAYLRADLDAVGFRSSSAVFAQYKRQIDGFRETLLQSIDFKSIRAGLRNLQNAIKDARRGQSGLNQLAAFHANEAWTLTSGLFEDLKKKEQSVDELEHRLVQMQEQIQKLELTGLELSPGPIKKLQADLKSDAPLPTWTEHFPDHATSQQSSKRIQEMRSRLRALWERAAAQEPDRAARFAEACNALAKAINGTENLPGVLPELGELRRSLEEFSPAIQRSHKLHVDEAFRAFRERAKAVGLLNAHFQEIRARIDKAHRRIYSPVDFEDLVARVDLGRRWARLRDFPDESRSSSLRMARTCSTELYKLQTRQRRMMAERETRGAEILRELETDVASSLAEAKATPGSQECWVELVALDQRLREATRFLNNDQLEQLRNALDEGFRRVKEARAAFAIEAGRRFAYYNDLLGEILADLEETPTKDAAFAAIDRLKPLRAQMREENSLLRGQRREIYGLFEVASQAVEEIFERASKESSAIASQLTEDIARFERQVGEASDWDTTFALVSLHKQQSAALRDARLSIAHRKEIRLQLEGIWEDIAEKLQQYRFSRASENIDAAVRRLEQRGWLLVVRDVPRAA